MIRYVVYPGPSAPAQQDDAVFVDVFPTPDPGGHRIDIEVLAIDELNADDLARILARIAGDAARWGLPRAGGALHSGDRARARMQGPAE